MCSAGAIDSWVFTSISSAEFGGNNGVSAFAPVSNVLEQSIRFGLQAFNTLSERVVLNAHCSEFQP